MISYLYLPGVKVTPVFTEAETSLLGADRSKFSVGMKAPFYRRLGKVNEAQTTFISNPGSGFPQLLEVFFYKLVLPLVWLSEVWV